MSNKNATLILLLTADLYRDVSVSFDNNEVPDELNVLRFPDRMFTTPMDNVIIVYKFHYHELIRDPLEIQTLNEALGLIDEIESDYFMTIQYHDRPELTSIKGHLHDPDFNLQTKLIITKQLTELEVTKLE